MEGLEVKQNLFRRRPAVAEAAAAVAVATRAEDETEALISPHTVGLNHWCLHRIGASPFSFPYVDFFLLF